MTQIVIRQSGGANIISIPKAILKTLGLDTGSSLDLSLEDNKIVLTPSKEQHKTLEELLAGSPKERLAMTDEDREWDAAKPMRREQI